MNLIQVPDKRLLFKATVSLIFRCVRAGSVVGAEGSKSPLELRNNCGKFSLFFCQLPPAVRWSAALIYVTCYWDVFKSNLDGNHRILFHLLHFQKNSLFSPTPTSFEVVLHFCFMSGFYWSVRVVLFAEIYMEMIRFLYTCCTSKQGSAFA